MRAAANGGAVERAIYVAQGRLGTAAIGTTAAEVVQYFLRAGRTDTEDRSVVVRAARRDVVP